MTKQELQTQILNNSRSLSRLASAIDKLPESGTRNEMVDKHNKILDRFSSLITELMLVDPNACYYGFTDKCPKIVCCECEYLLEEVEPPWEE